MTNENILKNIKNKAYNSYIAQKIIYTTGISSLTQSHSSKHLTFDQRMTFNLNESHSPIWFDSNSLTTRGKLI